MEIILKYFPDLLEKQVKQFSLLQPLYNEWNTQINIISRKDMENLYLKHVLHSLAIAKVISFADGTRVLDVGTGGGFPGIPLKIIFPNMWITLLESQKKRANFLRAAVRKLDLKKVEGFQNLLFPIHLNHFSYQEQPTPHLGLH